MARLYRYSTLLIFFVCIHAKAQPLVGRVGAVKGKVIISRLTGPAINQIVAQKGIPLYEKDEVTTGKSSQILLQLNGGEVVHVAEKSFYRVAFHQFNPKKGATFSISNLLYGLIRMTVHPIHKESQGAVEIHTPNSVIGVRGTQFLVASDEKTMKTEVLTEKGKVSFRSAEFDSKGNVLRESGETLVKATYRSEIVGQSASETALPSPSQPTRFYDSHLETLETHFMEGTDDLETDYSSDDEDGTETEESRQFNLGMTLGYIMSSKLDQRDRRSPTSHGLLGIKASYMYRAPNSIFLWGWDGELGSFAYNGNSHKFPFVAAGVGIRLLLPVNLHIGSSAHVSALPFHGFSDTWLGFDMNFLVGWTWDINAKHSIEFESGLLVGRWHALQNLLNSKAYVTHPYFNAAGVLVNISYVF